MGNFIPCHRQTFHHLPENALIWIYQGGVFQTEKNSTTENSYPPPRNLITQREGLYGVFYIIINLQGIIYGKEK